jgi:uncharacterized membrane protein
MKAFLKLYFSGMNKVQTIGFIFCIILGIVLMVHLHNKTKKCEDSGGVLVRSTFSHECIERRGK